MTLPTTGPYSNLMSSFFGYLSTAEQQALWISFLEKNNLTANPADTDTTAQTEFMTFIQSTYENNQTSLQSPVEMERRHLVFTVFDVVLLLMQKLQDSVATQSGVSAFLAKYQDEYATMLSKIPTYIGGSPNAGVLNLNDLSKFTLGYAGITMQDVAEYVFSQNASATVTSYGPVTNGESNLVNGTYTDPSHIAVNYYFTHAAGYELQITPTGTNGIEIRFVTQHPDKVVDDKTVYTSDGLPNILQYTFDPNATLDQKVEQFREQLQAHFGTLLTKYANYTNAASQPPWNDPLLATWLSNNPINSDNTAFIPWSETFNLVGPVTATGADNVDFSAAAQSRQQKNTLMQQYVTNILSYRETLSNQSDATSTNIQSTRDSLQGHASVLNSTISQLTNILNSIFTN